METISQIPQVIIDKRLNFKKQVDYVKQRIDMNINLLEVLNSLSDVNARIMMYIYTLQQYIGIDGPSQVR